ncbi:MAG: FHA domain-containing protein [Blautia sp.]|nr:FHA domain-containing protein [Lachnoclostridium sp.]MCM1212373.1 FHA domain-containing protein [Blautia sp.]
MIEAKYFRDYNHNYVILKCVTEGGIRDNYPIKMLASNKIDGLLKCSIRNVNGESYLYYNISSKVTLENLYQGKKLSYEQLKDFFCQMDRIYRSLGEFFMEEKGLLIQPEYLYYDLSSNKYFGLYYPMEGVGMKDIGMRNLGMEDIGMKDLGMENAGKGNPYEALMDFLLDHIDTKDQRLTELAYRIYERSEEACFSMAEALTLFEEAEEAPGKVCNVDDNGMEKMGVNGGQPPLSSEFSWDSSDYGKTEPLERGDRKPEAKIPSKQNKSRVFFGVFTVLSLCGLGAVCWIYDQFQLTQREQMILVCCGAAIGLCFLFSVAQIVLSGRREKRADKEEQELRWDIEDEFRDERPIALQEMLETKKDSSRGCNKDGQAGWKEPAKQYGETIFVDMQKQNREYKLYALDKKNKKHIELTQFPFTIGKMAGCVDCVLADDSISRLHARIEEQDGKVLLTDMNSRNGTYKNGLRMSPSETVEIEPGDEIRFGKLNYCYR